MCDNICFVSKRHDCILNNIVDGKIWREVKKYEL